MKTIKFSSMVMLVSLFMMSANFVKAQGADKDKAKSGATKISRFEAGRTLSEADLSFLKMVNGETGKDRGKSDSKEVVINKKKYSTGQKITKEDAAAISQKITAYGKAHKAEKATDNGANGKSRGSDCYYYCYYDAYGNYICYWYCY
jgi:hypothetical protein